MELDGYEPDVELTMDLIEAPYLFIYTTDEDAWNMKVFMRGIGDLFGESAAWAKLKLNALVTAGALSKITYKRVSYYFLN